MYYARRYAYIFCKITWFRLQNKLSTLDRLLEWLNNDYTYIYNTTEVYVTENGYADIGENCE